MHRMLDHGFPPSVDDYIADAEATGCDSLSGYVLNFSNPSAQYDVAYGQELVRKCRERGKNFLPIITPGMSPPDVDVVAAVRAWGVTSGPVAFDIENYSTPPTQWQQNAYAAFNGAGFEAGHYGSIYQTPSRLVGIGERFYWLATGDGNEAVPAGFDGNQFALDSWRGPASGKLYDASVMLDGFFAAARTRIAVLEAAVG